MPWGKGMVDMARTTEEKIVLVEQSMPLPAAAADYPYGLCLSLTEDELEKLDLDDDVEAGDTLHFMALATVKSVSKNDYNGEKSCRIELQITRMAVENEDDEADPKIAKRYSKG